MVAIQLPRFHSALRKVVEKFRPQQELNPGPLISETSALPFDRKDDVCCCCCTNDRSTGATTTRELMSPARRFACAALRLLPVLMRLVAGLQPRRLLKHIIRSRSSSNSSSSSSIREAIDRFVRGSYQGGRLQNRSRR